MTISSNFNVENASSFASSARISSGPSGISPHWLMVIVMGAGFLAAADATIIFPALWAYVQETLRASLFYYGLIAGGFNAAQAVVAPLFGLWADARGIKEVCGEQKEKSLEFLFASGCCYVIVATHLVFNNF
jgi:MFS family permease